MHSPKLLRIAFVGLVLAAIHPAAKSQACSAPECSPASFSVAQDFIVPANFGELTVWQQKELFGATEYVLTLYEASRPTQALLTNQSSRSAPYVSLASVLQPGVRYLVEATPLCAGGLALAQKGTLAFSVSSEESVPPTGLGPLEVVHSGSGKVPVSTGAICFAEREASVADFKLSADYVAEPWRNLLTNYQLFVDGKPFSWWLTIGSVDLGPSDTARGWYAHSPGVFRTFTLCDGGANVSELGVAPGRHEVWVQARVPTRTPSIIESEHVQIELQCPSEAAKPADNESTDGGSASGAGGQVADGDRGCSVGVGANSSSGRAPMMWLALAMVAIARSFGARKRVRK